MQVKSIYIADDGKEFERQIDCIEYENQLKEKEFDVLANYIAFYSSAGERLPYGRVARNEYCAYYAKVIEVPEEDTDVYELSLKVISDGLFDYVFYDGYGKWYVADGEGHWQSWKEISDEYTQRNETINAILCEGR